MGVDRIARIRQNDFSRGGDYSQSPFQLQNNQCASTENVISRYGLEAFPGAARVGAGQYPSGLQIELLYEYRKADGTVRTLAFGNNVGTDLTSVQESDRGFAAAWTTVTTGLDSSPYWKGITFNDVAIFTSTDNAPKSYDGTTFGDLAGSPPADARLVCAHGDYVLLAGHDGSIIRYSDTGTHIVWPVGNEIDIGVDSGQSINAMVYVGEVTAVFLEDNIWLLEGDTPANFARRPTRSVYGTRFPSSVCLTPYGLFFWSDWGPAVFDGVASTCYGTQLKRYIADVNLSLPYEIFCSYDPHNQLLYWRVGLAENTDKMFIQDLRNFDPESPVIWPLSWTAVTAMATLNNTENRNKVFLGKNDGYVLETDTGSTFDGDEYGCTVRSRYYSLGPIWKRQGVRRVDFALAATGVDVTVKHATDGSTTFTTNKVITPAATGDICYREMNGDGTGRDIVGRSVQFELTTATASFGLHELDTAFEDLGARGTDT
jgi:hypothetical protein